VQRLPLGARQLHSTLELGTAVAGVGEGGHLDRVDVCLLVVTGGGDVAVEVGSENVSQPLGGVVTPSVLVIVALLSCACVSTDRKSSGVFEFGVVGRVSDIAGTCVRTSYDGPYSDNGTVCGVKRLGSIGDCVRFSVSNINAAKSNLPTILDLVTVDQSECRGD
jgi:hypothetical protein